MAGDFGADGTVVHTGDLNAILKIVGIASPAVGSPPATGASSGYQKQIGRTSGTTDGTGFLNVTFPVAFPNGVTKVTLTCEDTGSQLISPALHGAPTKTGFTLYALTPANGGGWAGKTSSSVLVDWEADGF